jgi:SAM-dependent methyltransferase
MRHDIVTDDAPGEFDVIHARFVLDHLPQRDAVIRRMASWLKPGGWLLVEAGTSVPEASPHPATRSAMEAFKFVLARSVGTDHGWVRTLPLPLERAGLVDARSEGFVTPIRGGSPLAALTKASIAMITPSAIEAGVITEAQLAEARAQYDDPDFVDYSNILIAAWAHVPG